MAEPTERRYSSGNPRPDAPTVLKGIRVLDLATMVAGPLCANLLADFGAEVIKVEQPGVGDTLRGTLPSIEGTSLWWVVEGRNKRSITLNLRVPEGQELARRLVAVSDVLIENFLPGTMDSWNLGFDRLRAINPRLVVTSVSGFGQTGPLRRKHAYDRIAVAMGGWSHVTGDPDRPPGRPGFVLADYGTGYTAALGTMMALYYRDAQAGTGQQVDASLIDTAIRVTDRLIPAYDRLGQIRTRTGIRHPNTAPGDHFPTRDGGYVSVSASNNRMFGRLAQAMGQPELIEDPRFNSPQNRTKHTELVHQIVTDWTLRHDRDEVVRMLEENGVPAGPVYTVEDIVREPHFIEREMVLEVEDPSIGPVKIPGITPKLSETPGRIWHGAPRLGEANREIYCGLLGLSEADLDRLEAAGVI
ncbi:MAG TPA: CoA transferase [Dehalococcoidia bacterium]|nr:CoA transferase [Dehalococcoidia bacterium]